MYNDCRRIPYQKRRVLHRWQKKQQNYKTGKFCASLAFLEPGRRIITKLELLPWNSNLTDINKVLIAMTCWRFAEEAMIKACVSTWVWILMIAAFLSLISSPRGSWSPQPQSSIVNQDLIEFHASKQHTVSEQLYWITRDCLGLFWWAIFEQTFKMSPWE